jgi:hypothetical protein
VRQRTYPVSLTAKQIGLMHEALSLFYTVIENEVDAEEVDGLHQFFDNLHQTALELEPADGR